MEVLHQFGLILMRCPPPKKRAAVQKTEQVSCYDAALDMFRVEVRIDADDTLHVASNCSRWRHLNGLGTQTLGRRAFLCASYPISKLDMMLSWALSDEILFPS